LVLQSAAKVEHIAALCKIIFTFKPLDGLEKEYSSSKKLKRWLKSAI